MSQLHGSVLLIGYGNPGRLDDGLGPAVADAVQQIGYSNVAVDSCYQLAVEHAEAAARHEVVIFADADASGPAPFRFARIEPRVEESFTTHVIEPATILGLARDLFGASQVGYLLGIRGYVFDGFGEVISSRARRNLTAAVGFLKEALQEPAALSQLDFEVEANALASDGSRKHPRLAPSAQSPVLLFRCDKSFERLDTR